MAPSTDSADTVWFPVEISASTSCAAWAFSPRRSVMKRTNIYLAEGQVAALDRAAQAAGVSRAELIRELIDRAIGGHPGADLAADLAAIDGSFGILAGEDTFTRGPDERADYLGRLAGA
jgi:Ribbon-helix-helix protein, copG family